MTDDPCRSAARQLLARRLRLLRATRGWSQEVLAQLSGLHRTYISSVERTQCNISIDNLEKLAAASGNCSLRCPTFPHPCGSLT